MKLRHRLSTKLSAAIAMVLLLLVLALSSTGQAATYIGLQNVSSDGANSLLPRSAQAPNGDLHVVWDTTEGGRKIRWRKGSWNPNAGRYDFNASAVIGDVGGFQYSTPSIGIAPNGTVLATWSNGFQVYGRTWNMNDAQPPASSQPFVIMPGFDTSIAVDSNSRFHIVANGDFQVQYCELQGAQCVKRDSFSRDLNATPDVTVDSSNGVHLIWAGQGIRYRYRPAGGDWNTIVRLSSGGNVPQISADGEGSVHIVWSQDYDIQYCRKSITALNTDCVERFKGDAAQDLSPSIGVTRGGNVFFAFYDQEFKSMWGNTDENDSWTSTRELAPGRGPTRPDLTSRPYSNRVSAVWSVDYEIVVLTAVLPPTDCDDDLGTSLAVKLDAKPNAIPMNGLYLPVAFAGPQTVDPEPGPGC